MDRARQERRIDILVVLIVLLTVVLFWILHPQLPFSSYGREANSPKDRIKSTLESIHPLDGDHLGEIQIVNLSSGDLWVTRTNSTMSLCTALEAHYKEEFARHGFTYTGTREASATAERSISFSSQDYGASLSCTEPEHSLMGSYKTYRISMWPNSSD